MTAIRRPRACLLTALVALAVSAPASAAHADPDPGLRAKQWYLDVLRVPELHAMGVTGQGVTVAVIDSGVDSGHPDLGGGTVLPGVVTGGPGDGRTDPSGHGTEMAGIIAAHGAVQGIAPAAQILPVVPGNSARSFSEALAESIRVAADRSARVISISIGTDDEPGPELDAAITYAASRDAVIVAAAGNTADGFTNLAWPAKSPGVLAVTGLSRDGSFSVYSAQGPEAALSAPAESITSITSRTVAGSTGYSTATGTSPAAAMVSGTAALIRQRYPELSAAGVVRRLTATARDAGPAGRDPQYGYGRLSPYEAVTVPEAELPTASPSASPRRGRSGPASYLPLWVAVLVLAAAAVAFARSRASRRA
ncbi:S8 family serine peptidase [Longispora albida]|uniref:S8 family serine peptidase n=1 Tax=Longispora albida TaxID=203523 RepID=UPI0012FA6FB2|nr:S8 family serine peptidase [Longispora albida]